MAKIVRYNGNLQAFASAAPGTERTIFGDVTQANDLTSQINADFLRGWGIVGPSDQPALEDFNGAMYTHGQLLAYLHQTGIPEYNAAQEYHIGSVCNFSGELFSSLTNNNTGNTPSSSPSAWGKTGVGRLIGIQKFTASGTYTPTVGMRFCIIEVMGGGGGGGGCGATSGSVIAVSGGGGQGSMIEGQFTAVDIGVSKPVTIGAGGAGGIGVGAGGAGGTSSVGSLISASGGVGAGAGIAAASGTSVAAAGGVGGLITAGGNIIGWVGMSGGLGVIIGGSFRGGSGGGLGGGQGGSTPDVVGAAGGGPGAGGGGVASDISSAAKTGGAGQAGTVIIREFS